MNGFDSSTIRGVAYDALRERQLAAKEPPSSGSERRPCSAELRRKSKALASTIIAKMLDNWMCDGYPTGNDSDDYDVEIFLAEAMRFQRIVDSRVDQLSRQNDLGDGRRNGGPNPT